MATKIKARPRKTRRVEDSESSGNKVSKSARHRQVGGINVLDGEMLISSQFSELVPVAQYANVTIGPVQLAQRLSDTSIEILIDADFDNLTREQQAVYDRIKGAIIAMHTIIEDVISEDREAVHESVKKYNEQEETEKKNARKRSRSGK